MTTAFFFTACKCSPASLPKARARSSVQTAVMTPAFEGVWNSQKSPQAFILRLITGFLWVCSDYFNRTESHYNFVRTDGKERGITQ